MAGYLISMIRPRGYQHSDAFTEVAETLLYGLRTLGHASAILENTVDPRVTNLILGAHLLKAEECQALPEGSILYNLEQLGSAHLSEAFYGLAAHYPIWDYSPANIALWKQRAGLAFEPRLVSIGYCPALRRIPVASVQDIDVLFYGSINEHRRSMLLLLKQAGIRVHAVFGVYGKERDALIARSKIVLNLHCYDAKLFEVVRVSYLLTNSKAVVSETADDMGDFTQAIAAVRYEEIVARCKALLADDEERRALERRGYEFFSQRDEAAMLLPVVGTANEAIHETAGAG